MRKRSSTMCSFTCECNFLPFNLNITPQEYHYEDNTCIVQDKIDIYTTHRYTKSRLIFIAYLSRSRCFIHEKKKILNRFYPSQLIGLMIVKRD